MSIWEFIDNNLNCFKYECDENLSDEENEKRRLDEILLFKEMIKNSIGKNEIENVHQLLNTYGYPKYDSDRTERIVAIHTDDEGLTRIYLDLSNDEVIDDYILEAGSVLDEKFDFEYSDSNTIKLYINGIIDDINEEMMKNSFPQLTNKEKNKISDYIRNNTSK